MFRIHNTTTESKIDWLVKNENLLDKKLVISPWDDDGMKCFRYLSDKWGG